ncbi:MAG: MFS transporter [Pyrinomonadaceae bacterium]
MKRPNLSFWQIWNMSFGFLGIQFGWALQLNNMSVIYEKLGAKPEDIPILWLAAPLTGLIVQPIIGSMSDRTWGPLGRRRPYFLVGAILASIALIWMPNSSTLWMAAGLLWILDASINISMEPFRAFVADKLNVDQRTGGFVMQSFFIGLGATAAGVLPYVLRDRFGVIGDTAGGIPLTIKYAFQIGAVCFLLAVLWTVFTSKEYPPDDMAEFERQRREKHGFGAGLSEIFHSYSRDADDDETAGCGADFYLAGALLHVALLCAGGSASCVWRDRPAIGSLHARRRVGRPQHVGLFNRLLCRRLCVAKTRRGNQPENSARVCSRLRRRKFAFALFCAEPQSCACDDDRRWRRVGFHTFYALRHPRRIASRQAHRRLHGRL